MDEFFDIEKDTETFTTALLTALILNGGKALTVKIKGKKMTVTAEDVEKCIDKDGNLDVEKLINETSILQKLKKKFKQNEPQTKEDETQITNNSIDWSRFNTNDIDFSEWSNALNNYYSYFEKNKNIFLANGKSMEDIQGFFNQVCMCSDPDYLKYIKSIYGKKETVSAFNVDGIIFMPSDMYAKDIAHEVTHSWGALYYDSTGKYNRNYNAISEAVTETIACSMGFEDKTVVSYTCNIEHVERITRQLEKRGYKNAFLDAYLSSDTTKIKSIIDNIAGEGYYDELASRFYENQNNYIKAYTTNDWSEYNRTADAMDVFLNALD